MSHMSQLDGTYRCLSAVLDGRPLDAAVAEQLQLTLDGDLYRTSKGSQTLFAGRYAVNHETFPWRIDITAIDGPHAGQTAQGLVRREDRSLRICHTMPGQKRPGDFVSEATSGAQLVVWQRIVDPAD